MTLEHSSLLSEQIARALDAAIAEDLGSGDVTCEFFVDPKQQGEGRIVAREAGVTAGSRIAAEVFARIDRSLRVEINRPDGSFLAPGDVVLTVTGSVRSILTGERVALNFLQRLSGIATLTRKFVDLATDNRASILDTRKTTPGLRALEKAAVLAGGGANHRFGLYDMAMVKDNHLAARGDLGFLQKAISRLRSERPNVKVELEADTLEQVRGFLTLEGVDVILLDNMSPHEMAEAVSLGGGSVKFEASGGVNLETVGAIAGTGVDFISIGALTHSARALDFSLELEQHHG